MPAIRKANGPGAPISLKPVLQAPILSLREAASSLRSSDYGSSLAVLTPRAPRSLRFQCFRCGNQTDWRSSPSLLVRHRDPQLEALARYLPRLTHSMLEDP